MTLFFLQGEPGSSGPKGEMGMKGEGGQMGPRGLPGPTGKKLFSFRDYRFSAL